MMMSDAYCKKHFIGYCPDLSKVCPYCRIAELEAENTEAYNNGYANAALKFADRSAKLEEIMESDWFKYMKEHGNDRG